MRLDGGPVGCRPVAVALFEVGLNITAQLAGAVSFLVAAIVGRANQPGRTATGCGLAGR